MKPVVVLGLSGGVDSAVAALKLLAEGYNVIAVSLRLLDAEDVHHRSCCSPEDLFDAARVADALNIPHYIIDRRELFHKAIIQRYLDYYRRGLTPNPCTWCNREIKFRFLLEIAEMLGADKVATGHYAQIVRLNGKFAPARAKDRSKDQSYFLYTIDHTILRKVLFPLAETTKEEVRKIARESGLPVSRKRESQQACFLPEKGHVEFLRRRLGEQPGAFIGPDNNPLGEHRGYWFYTVGQRKGLRVSANRKMYVKEIRAGENIVVLGYENDIYSESMKVERVVLHGDQLKPGTRLSVQIRHRHPAAPCEITRVSDKVIEVKFLEAQRAVTPGQAAVFYHGDIIVAGGEIAKK